MICQEIKGHCKDVAGVCNKRAFIVRGTMTKGEGSESGDRFIGQLRVGKIGLR